MSCWMWVWFQLHKFLQSTSWKMHSSLPVPKWMSSRLGLQDIVSELKIKIDRLHSSLDPFYRLRLVSKHDLSMCRKRRIRPMANVHGREWYRSWTLFERLRHWGYFMSVRLRRWLLSRPESMSLWGLKWLNLGTLQKIYVDLIPGQWSLIILNF